MRDKILTKRRKRKREKEMRDRKRGLWKGR